jgi:hypothetical protein
MQLETLVLGFRCPVRTEFDRRLLFQSYKGEKNKNIHKVFGECIIRERSIGAGFQMFLSTQRSIISSEPDVQESFHLRGSSISCEVEECRYRYQHNHLLLQVDTRNR